MFETQEDPYTRTVLMRRVGVIAKAMMNEVFNVNILRILSGVKQELIHCQNASNY